MDDNPSRGVLHLLSNTALFHDLNQTQIQSIFQSGRQHHIDRHAFLFHQGEPSTSFYVLLDGNVQLTQINPERRQVITSIGISALNFQRLEIQRM